MKNQIFFAIFYFIFSSVSHASELSMSNEPIQVAFGGMFDQVIQTFTKEAVNSISDEAVNRMINNSEPTEAGNPNLVQPNLVQPNLVQIDSQVREVQQRLAELGYSPGPADGIMGKKTRYSIYAYQKSVGMQIDGKPSEQLLQSLRSQSPSSDLATSKPLTTEEIIEIQQHLTDMDFAPDLISGNVDARTESAIYAYQREFDLPADGKPSMKVLLSLRSKNTSNDRSSSNVHIPPIEVPMASNLRRWERTLYYECEKELNTERKSEGLPEIKLISQKEAQQKAQEARKQFMTSKVKNMYSMVGNNDVPRDKDYMSAMVDQQNALLAKKLASANNELNRLTNIQKEHEEKQNAMLELKYCVTNKTHKKNKI